MTDTAVLDREADCRAPEDAAGRREELVADTLARLGQELPFRDATVTEVVVLPQRSLCLRVRFADGRRVVVKRALPSTGPLRRGSIAHETAVVTRLHRLGLPVPRPLPTSAGLLVTEDAAEQGTLADCRTAAGGTSPDWAQAVGRSLAAVHTGVTPARLPQTDPARGLLCSWTAVRTGLPSSPAVDRFARHLALAGLDDLLEEAVAGWSPSCLVHGDVRAENVLCGRDPEDRRPVRLVDWEVAGHGDPRWDVGCLIGDLLAGWVDALDVDTEAALAGRAAPAAVAFPALATEVAALTGAYAAVRPVTAEDRRQWLRYAAFPLVERACAASLTTLDLTPRSRACLLVAGHLLRRPGSCGELLWS